MCVFCLKWRIPDVAASLARNLLCARCFQDSRQRLLDGYSAIETEGHARPRGPLHRHFSGSAERPTLGVAADSSTAPDTDFTAKLVNILPNGRAINITEGILRASYRDSNITPPRSSPARSTNSPSTWPPRQTYS